MKIPILSDRLRSILPRKHTPQAFATPMAPDDPFYAVGDIHGRLDLFERLMDRIGRDVEDQGHDSSRIVFLGDYIDRGDAPAAVLNHVRELCDSRPGKTICLCGNHEQMMLDFLDDPATWGELWMQNGGMRTLESFGIGGLSKSSSLDDLIDASSALERAMPDGMQTWLKNLPLFWQSGNVVCVHAGMDPDTPPGEQIRDTMLWGHGNFARRQRRDGIWVVHGHTIVREPVADGGRVSVDTGAFHFGRLIAAAISDGGCLFLQV